MREELKTSVHQGFFSSQLLAPSLLKLSPFKITKEEVEKQESFFSSYKVALAREISP
jgi:hypothetical protein